MTCSPTLQILRSGFVYAGRENEFDSNTTYCLQVRFVAVIHVTMPAVVAPRQTYGVSTLFTGVG